tara:strand:- start:2462 stop:2743 length:282 start_codon:yes stop_codon:yes gene_type:complete
LNNISPYIEISKPNLRNNQKQLFAMKNNSIFLPATLVAIFFVVSAISILDPAPQPTRYELSPAQKYDRAIDVGSLIHAQNKLRLAQHRIAEAQ